MHVFFVFYSAMQQAIIIAKKKIRKIKKVMFWHKNSFRHEVKQTVQSSYEVYTTWMDPKKTVEYDCKKKNSP